MLDLITIFSAVGLQQELEGRDRNLVIRAEDSEAGLGGLGGLGGLLNHSRQNSLCLVASHPLSVLAKLLAGDLREQPKQPKPPKPPKPPKSFCFFLRAPRAWWFFFRHPRYEASFVESAAEQLAAVFESFDTALAQGVSAIIGKEEPKPEKKV